MYAFLYIRYIYMIYIYMYVYIYQVEVRTTVYVPSLLDSGKLQCTRDTKARSPAAPWASSVHRSSHCNPLLLLLLCCSPA